MQLIESLINGVDLSETEAEACLDLVLNEPNEALISAVLVLLRAKGETFEEVTLLFCFTFYILCLIYHENVEKNGWLLLIFCCLGCGVSEGYDETCKQG